MSRKNILVIEDDEDILELVVHNLAREGLDARGVSSGEEGLKRLRSEVFDCVILDLMLPGMSGLELCRIIKNDQKTQNIPVVMVTAKGEEADVVAGLELGADDYVIKPFSPRVLMARLRSVLRRKSRESVGDDVVLTIDKLVIHPGRREVMLDGKLIDLTNLEFRVLHLLASKPGWVYTRYQIVEGIRGESYPVTDRSVDVMLVGLRRKLGDYGPCIETVRGVGYRFRELYGNLA